MDTNFYAIDALSHDIASGGPYREGVVIKKNIGIYQVQTDGRHIACEISAKLRKQLVYSAANQSAKRRFVQQVKNIEHTDPVAVGDRVRFIQRDAETGFIVEVLPRRNRLARRAAGSSAFEQVIVANVDQVVAVLAAARPLPKWNLLDRYLVSAEAMELPALICLTKADLCADESGELETELEETLAEYRRIGYQTMVTSARTGQGLEALRAELRDKTSVLIGKSGVGKSSLLNGLQPGLGLQVGDVSRQTGKGRHTTAHLEMFPLEAGGALVDTPGTREFGLWEIEAEDLAAFFPEMRPLVGRCKFGLDCRHDEEPGCAIRKAVMTGEISPRRYHSYLRLAEESR